MFSPIPMLKSLPKLTIHRISKFFKNKANKLVNNLKDQNLLKETAKF